MLCQMWAVAVRRLCCHSRSTCPSSSICWSVCRVWCRCRCPSRMMPSRRLTKYSSNSVAVAWCPRVRRYVLTPWRRRQTCHTQIFLRASHSSRSKQVHFALCFPSWRSRVTSAAMRQLPWCVSRRSIRCCLAGLSSSTSRSPDRRQKTTARPAASSRAAPAQNTSRMPKHRANNKHSSSNSNSHSHNSSRRSPTAPNSQRRANSSSSSRRQGWRPLCRSTRRATTSASTRTDS
mmetsp:Transcript_1629/g.3533  ORF Transcript_1629/g.3533 Transcript_1629/m.3533 type:complete len:233 (-) Transcript_1629:399-1097(-)